MRPAHRWLLVPFCLVLAAVPSTVLAYKLIQALPDDGTYCYGGVLDCDDEGTFIRWFEPVVPYWINENAAADSAISPLTQAEIIEAAQISYQQWEDAPGSFLKFTYMGETPNRIAADGVNTTLFYNAELDDHICVSFFGEPSDALAITIFTQDVPLGEITDVDVVFDSADTWEWSTDCVHFDLQGTLTHEYGHMVGLHHTDVWFLDMALRPTMVANNFCDVGVGSRRTLEPDDEDGIACLHPVLPAVLLMDQTGSMTTGSRMADSQEAANAFIDDFADNLMSVAAFAEGPCPEGDRDGYDLLQIWTDVTSLLHDAVDGTSPCGVTPMWESICCGIGTAVEEDPGILLVFTDTEENASDDVCSADCPADYCGCTNVDDVVAMAAPTEVVVYVIDMTDYFSSLDGPDGDAVTQEPNCLQQPVNQDGRELLRLATETGGLYCTVFDPVQLEEARLAVQRHMMAEGKARRNPPTCFAEPGELLADHIQAYDSAGNPNSPYDGQEVAVTGTVTASRGTFDAETLYVEDCSGGIQVFDLGGPADALGDTVRVRGTVGQSLGEIRISPMARMEWLGPGEPPLTPIVDPGTGQVYEMIGSLMTVRGYAGDGVVNDRFPLVQSMGATKPGVLTVYIDPDTGIDPGAITRGDWYRVTGVLTRRLGENELKPRYPEDIVRMTPGSAVPGEASHQDVPAELMRASYDKVTGLIDVVYTPACDAANHTIYYGDLAAVPSYLYAGAECYVGVSGSATFDPGLDDAFFVIVGENGIDEGSYGQASGGAERPEDVGTPVCDRVQSLGGVICE